MAVQQLKIDVEKHEVYVGEDLVELTAKEFNLLLLLVNGNGKVFSREELLEKVWGTTLSNNSRTLDVHVRRLRSKLGSASKCLRTLYGIGYKFKPLNF
jgi:two-component system alkaline phosphatase synthesis response regulator PhoP